MNEEIIKEAKLVLEKIYKAGFNSAEEIKSNLKFFSATTNLLIFSLILTSSLLVFSWDM